MHRTLTTPKPLCEDLIHPSSTAGHWLDETPYIVETLSEDEHLPFLVQLFINLNQAGIRLDDHLDCVVAALIEEEMQ